MRAAISDPRKPRPGSPVGTSPLCCPLNAAPSSTIFYSHLILHCPLDRFVQPRGLSTTSVLITIKSRFQLVPSPGRQSSPPPRPRPPPSSSPLCLMSTGYLSPPGCAAGAAGLSLLPFLSWRTPSSSKPEAWCHPRPHPVHTCPIPSITGTCWFYRLCV